MNTKSNHFICLKAYDIVLVIIAWTGIIMQMCNSTNLGHTLSYFTILSNLLIALSLTFSILIPKTGIGKFSSNISVQGTLSSYIIIVCLIYNIVIRKEWAEPYPQFIYNNIVHVLTPFFFVLRWFIYIPKGTLTWKDGVKWLSFPLAYMIYALILGKISGWYPYFFVDLNNIAVGIVVRNIIIVQVLFFIIGLLLIGIDRLMRKKKVA